MPVVSEEVCQSNCHGKVMKAGELHPDHSTHLKKLNRVIGQLQGVQRMIENRRYCPDILTQTRAAAAALKAVELKILQSHMESCVQTALKSRNAAGANEMLQEVVDLLQRF